MEKMTRVGSSRQAVQLGGFPDTQVHRCPLQTAGYAVSVAHRPSVKVTYKIALGAVVVDCND